MKDYFLIAFCYTLSLYPLYSQILEDPDDMLMGSNQVPKVLLVGTFHFGYPGLDAHKTKDDYRIDILSDKRQAEVRELLDYLKLFKPTKIMLEAGKNTGYLMHRMRKWKSGDTPLGRRESDQLALRLMDEMNLDTIYGVDAMGLSAELARSKDSLAYRGMFEDIYVDRAEKPSKVDDRYWDWYDRDDELNYETDLLTYFKHMNSDKVITRMHGHYILNDRYDDYNAVDGWLLMNWYSRNLRIFKNIQRVDTKPDDRILVLFGAGHLAILKHLFEATPEYEYVPFNSLDK